jgi:hypothetical protein
VLAATVTAVPAVTTVAVGTTVTVGMRSNIPDDSPQRADAGTGPWPQDVVSRLGAWDVGASAGMVPLSMPLM